MSRHGLALIVDEVFLDYPLREVVSVPRSFAGGEHPALTFVLSGLSKICGLPQMKAAWIATLGPEGARAEALARLEFVADTFLSMNAPVQLAMPSWLAGRGSIQADDTTATGSREPWRADANGGGVAGATAGVAGGCGMERGGLTSQMRGGYGVCGATGARARSAGSPGIVLWDGGAESDCR